MKTTGFKYNSFRLLGLLAAVFMAAVTLVACGDESPAAPGDVDEEAGMMKISFRVAASAPRLSRASGEYEDGVDQESVIDFASESYRVYFFDDENKFLAEWQRVAEVNVFKGVDDVLYTFKGAIPSKLKDHEDDFQIVVLANWPAYPDYRDFDLEGKTIDELVSANWACFDHFTSFDLKEDGLLIPFYGLMPCEGRTFESNKTYDLGEVNLLRAVAKVEVNLTQLPADVILDGDPVIHGINPRGYCAPKGKVGTGSDWDTDYVTALHLPGDKNHDDANDLSSPMLKVGEHKWIAYLPEFDNKTADDKYSYIQLELKDAEDNSLIRDFELNFATYDENGRPDMTKQFDIRRNDLYRFNVKGDLHEIKFSLKVTPWVEGGRTEIDM